MDRGGAPRGPRERARKRGPSSRSTTRRGCSERTTPAQRAEACGARPYPSGGPASCVNAGPFRPPLGHRRLRQARPFSVLGRAIVTVLSWVRRVLGSIYSSLFPDPLRRHRRADRTAWVRVGRGGHASGQRGSGIGKGGSPQSSAGSSPYASCPSAASAPRSRAAKRSRPARRPAEMAYVDPGLRPG